MKEIRNRANPTRLGIVGCGAVTQKYHLRSAKRMEGCSVTILVDNNRSRREFIPNPQRLALFRSKARVRIDKAREILGYEPRFDLQSGMERTKMYVQWVNPEG